MTLTESAPSAVIATDDGALGIGTVVVVVLVVVVVEVVVVAVA